MCLSLWQQQQDDFAMTAESRAETKFSQTRDADASEDVISHPLWGRGAMKTAFNRPTTRWRQTLNRFTARRSFKQSLTSILFCRDELH